MNFAYEIKKLKRRIEEDTSALETLTTQFEHATEFTGEFLDECAKTGMTKVGIQKTHKSIPTSVTFPFGSCGNIFGAGRDKTGWPAIWGVVERCGISRGCGNTDQHQANCENLIDGVYHLRKGKWFRLKNLD